MGTQDKDETALNAVEKYILEELKAHTHYVSSKAKERQKKEMPVISKEIRLFWKKCMEAFEEEVIHALYGRDFKLHTESMVKREKAPLVQIVSKNPDTGYSFWTAPMYSCMVAFAEVMQESNITLVQKENIIRLFTELRTKLEKYEERNARQNELRGSILGSTNFIYLPYLLNLQEESIRGLLPYLLTAYTFNYWNNRFFSGKTKLVPIICSTPLSKEYELLDPSEAAKLRPNIKNLVKIFSLKDSKGKFVKFPDTKNDSCLAPLGSLFDGMEAKDIESPYIRYKKILDVVFDVWCKVVEECAPLAEIEGFPSNIDFKGCKELYFRYTNPD